MVVLRWVLVGAASVGWLVAGCGSRSWLESSPWHEPDVSQGGGAQGGDGGQGGWGGQGAGGGAQGGEAGSGGQGGEPPPNPVISRSADSVMEAETHVVAGSGARVAAAWIATQWDGLPYIAYSFSTDGGASWEAPLAMPSPNGGVGADPVLAVDADDNVYLTWVGYYYGATEPYDMHIYVARAEVGTTTFAAPVEVTDPLDGFQYDKPWIAATSQGTVVVSYMRESGNDVRIVSARSTDGGQTFTRGQLANVYGNLAYLCASPTDQRVWATYFSFDTWPVRVLLRRSDDDGQTWPASTEREISTESDVGYSDPSCAVSGDDVWVLYGLTHEELTGETTPLLYQMRLAHSADGGETVAETFDAQEPGAYTHALLPTIALEPGAVHLTFFSGEYEGDPLGAFRRRRALLQGGIPTFEPSVVVERPVMLTGERSSIQWLGDYTGVTVRDGTFYAVFPVNKSGESHVAFHRREL